MAVPAVDRAIQKNESLMEKKTVQGLRLRLRSGRDLRLLQFTCSLHASSMRADVARSQHVWQ